MDNRKLHKVCSICGTDTPKFIEVDGRMINGYWREEDETFTCVTCAFKQASEQKQKQSPAQ